MRHPRQWTLWRVGLVVHRIGQKVNNCQKNENINKVKKKTQVLNIEKRCDVSSPHYTTSFYACWRHFGHLWRHINGSNSSNHPMASHLLVMMYRDTLPKFRSSLKPKQHTYTRWCSNLNVKQSSKTDLKIVLTKMSSFFFSTKSNLFPRFSFDLRLQFARK